MIFLKYNILDHQFFVLILNSSNVFYLVPFVLFTEKAMRAYHKTEHVNVIGKVFKFIFIPQSSLMVQTGKNLPAIQETWVHFLGWEDPLEKGMATNILAWRFHEQRSLTAYSPPGHKELDMTELLSKQ